MIINALMDTALCTSVILGNTKNERLGIFIHFKCSTPVFVRRDAFTSAQLEICGSGETSQIWPDLYGSRRSAGFDIEVPSKLLEAHADHGYLRFQLRF